MFTLNCHFGKMGVFTVLPIALLPLEEVFDLFRHHFANFQTSFCWLLFEPVNQHMGSAEGGVK